MADAATNISETIGEHWETAHQILGERYTESVAPYRRMLQEGVRSGRNIMDVALAACRALSEGGHNYAVIFVSAAVYDELADEVERHTPKDAG